MEEKIAQILVYNATKAQLIDIINQAGGIMNSSKFEKLLEDMKAIAYALDNIGSILDEGVTCIDDNYESYQPTQKELEILREQLKLTEEYVIYEYDGFCILNSEWFAFSDIFEKTEELFGSKELDCVAIGTDTWNVFVAALYEKGQLEAKFVVGSYEDIYSKKDNFNLSAFDNKFGLPLGTFEKLKKERNILKARQKFEQLTSITLDDCVN